MPKCRMVDIAQAAGVSVATVGRVLHSNGYVSPENRRRVEEKIRELGYVPNRMASALKGQRSGIIGSLITHNPNFLYERINGSVLEAAERYGYEVFSMEGRPGYQEEERIIDQFIGMQVEGIVIISNPNVPEHALEKLKNLSIPVVAVERCYEREAIDNLRVLDFEGVKDTVALAVAKGHRRLALIAAKPDASVEQERYEGFEAARKQAGLPEEAIAVELCPGYGREQGFWAMQRIWERGFRPSLVFATSDMLAAGAMQYLYEKHFRIPEDISIIGYDNTLSASLAPAIDSVDLDLESIGEHVFSLLQERSQKFDKKTEERPIATRYIDRGTVRRLSEKPVSG